MSKLISYCDGVMEAAWLLALLCTPLFFSVWGEALQAEKSYLLGSLAIVLLAAWAAKLVLNADIGKDKIEPRWFQIWPLLKTPLVAPTLAVAVIMIMSTLFSLSPGESFFGLPSRRDGSCMGLFCLLFFSAMAANVHSELQVNRIVTVAILTSLPISLYGIGQGLSIDPVIAGYSASFRVCSTLGNAVFLAAYLIMLFPLSLSRILDCFSKFRGGSSHRIIELIPVLIYGLIAILQLLTIVLTISRGPSLGLFTGLLVMALLLAVYWRKRWLVCGGFGAGFVILTVLILLSRPNGPWRSIAERPGVQRFTEMLKPQTEGSGRIAIWNLAAKTARFSKVVERSEGRKDTWSSLRFLFGYGPQSARLLVPVYRTPEYNAAQHEIVFLDHYHNSFWETLVTTGIMGLCASLALTYLVVFFGCQWLGLMVTPRHRTNFWLLLVSGSLIGVFGLVSWKGMSYLGVGLWFGTSFGLIVFLSWISWRNDFDPTTHGVPMKRAFLLMGLLAGLVAHWTEINFSFATETTLLYSWIFVGLLLVIGYFQPLTESNQIPLGAKDDLMAEDPGSNHPKAVPAKTRHNRKAGLHKLPNSTAPSASSWHQEISMGLIVGLVFTNLGAMLIFTHLRDGRSTGQTLLDAFTRLPGKNYAFTWIVPLALLAIWLLSAMAWTCEIRPNTRASRWLRSMAMVLAVSGTIGLVCWIVLANYGALILAPTRVSLETLNGYLRNYTQLVDLFYGMTFLLLLFLAAFLPGQGPGSKVQPDPFIRFKYCALFALAFGAVAILCTTNLKWSKVGVIMNRAEFFKSQRQWPLVAATCELAITALPTVSNHYVALSEALIEQFTLAKDMSQRRTLLSQADSVLETASRKIPIDLVTLMMRRGDLYLKWAEMEAPPDRRISLGEKAIEFYQRAAVLDPYNDELYYRLGYVEMAVLQSPDKALPWLLRSLDCYQKSHTTYALLGNIYYSKGTDAKESREQDVNWKSAATNYQHAIELAAKEGKSAINSQYLYSVALGKCQIKLRDLAQAIPAYQSALELSPPAEQWVNEEVLARLYADSKDKSNSIGHLQRAIERAPADKRSALTNLMNKILLVP
jgi:tetratricopeptide (TPR) repeat protein